MRPCGDEEAAQRVPIPSLVGMCVCVVVVVVIVVAPSKPSLRGFGQASKNARGGHGKMVKHTSLFCCWLVVSWWLQLYVLFWHVWGLSISIFEDVQV